MDIWGSEPPCAWAELDPWKRGRGSKRGLAWGSDKLVRDAKNERERRGQHRALGVRAPSAVEGCIGMCALVWRSCTRAAWRKGPQRRAFASLYIKYKKKKGRKKNFFSFLPEKKPG